MAYPKTHKLGPVNVVTTASGLIFPQRLRGEVGSVTINIGPGTVLLAGNIFLVGKLGLGVGAQNVGVLGPIDATTVGLNATIARTDIPVMPVMFLAVTNWQSDADVTAWFSE